MDERIGKIPFFADLTGQLEVVTALQMEAVVPAGGVPSELRRFVLGTLSHPLRALFYLKQKAARDAQVAVLDIALAPVRVKDDAKTKALSLARRSKWLEATFHEAVLQEFPGLSGKLGFGIGPHWSVLDLDQLKQIEQQELGLGSLSDLMNLFASRDRRSQPH